MQAVNEEIILLIPKLRRYARGLTGNKERADDLVQDCLARALAKISLWKPGTNLQSWLFTIMHNIFINECKKKENNTQTTPIEEQADMIALDADPEQAMFTEDMLKQLMNLSPNQREVLLLVSVEGQSYEEVSVILNIPVGTVMSRLHRARETMRKKMQQNMNERNTVPLRRIK